MSWPFREVQPAVAHLLDNLDVSRFGTTYSLMNSMDGTVIVPRTESLADLYSFWNASVHAEREFNNLYVTNNPSKQNFF